MDFEADASGRINADWCSCPVVFSVHAAYGLAWGRGWAILRPWRGLTDLERQRVRCVFSESMNDNALDVSTGAKLGGQSGGPPGRLPGGMMEWRATAAVLRSTVRVLRSRANHCTSVVDDLVTTVFPADCRACGCSLLRADSSTLIVPVCDLCLSRLSPQSKAIHTALCRCCGEALGMESDRFASPVEGLLCTPCRMVPPPFERAVAYGVYEGELREMLHLLKYDGVRTLAGPLGAKLADAVMLFEASAAWPGDLAVVAVPLHSTNGKARGFNQSVLLADAAVSRLRKLRPGWKLTARHDLLGRVKATESQFNLSTRGRRRNLVGAFKVEDARNELAGRDVLLIDDIYTTGATSRACAQVLGRAGARRVWVATLARAQREQVEFWSSSGGDFG